MKVGIIGHLGVIGSAMKRHLENEVGHLVTGYDIADDATRMIDVKNCSCVFVCVPTPTSEFGRSDTSIVEETINGLINHIDYTGHIFIRSTVTPGTTDRLSKQFQTRKLHFMPEFVRERCADQDMKDINDIIVGVTKVSENPHMELMHVFDRPNVILCSSAEAEYMKYFHNALNATKITFANVFYEMMEKEGVNYSKMLMDYGQLGLNETKYLEVNPSKRGFGGPCLPKDTRAIASHGRFIGVDQSYFLDEVIRTNKKFPITVPPGMRDE